MANSNQDDTGKSTGIERMTAKFKGAELGVRLRSNTVLTTCLAASFAAASVLPSYAAITNTATVSGTSPGGSTVTNTDSESVDVATPSQSITVGKVFDSLDDEDLSTTVNAGDTLNYTITVTNNGNVTLTDVTPSDTGPTFGGVAGDNVGSLTITPATTASLSPGASATYDVVYTLSTNDIYRGAAAGTDGVDNTASAIATGVTGGVGGVTGTAPLTETTISESPSLTVAKSATLTKGGGNTDPNAEVGDIIEYTYLVTNAGNVAVNNIFISDSHEFGESGAAIFDSSDVGATLGTNPGEWQMVGGGAPTFGLSSDDALDVTYDVLAVGDTVTFTYYHQVTLAEFQDQ